MDARTLVERMRTTGGTCMTDYIENIIGESVDDVRCAYRECEDCHTKALNALADAIEREYLPRPRYEDGEPVQFGDAYTDKHGIAWLNGIRAIHIDCNGEFSLRGHTLGHSGMFADFRRNERVKRPEPEVLDADGVPIKVGDTLWNLCNGVKVVVDGLRDGGFYSSIGGDYTRNPCVFSHKQPDSLERIEEDALMASTDYCDKYGLLDSGCNAEEGDGAVRHCTDCGLTCEKRMINHLLRRQREVLGGKR